MNVIATCPQEPFSQDERSLGSVENVAASEKSGCYGSVAGNINRTSDSVGLARLVVRRFGSRKPSVSRRRFENEKALCDVVPTNVFSTLEAEIGKYAGRRSHILFPNGVRNITSTVHGTVEIIGVPRPLRPRGRGLNGPNEHVLDRLRSGLNNRTSRHFAQGSAADSLPPLFRKVTWLRPRSPPNTLWVYPLLERRGRKSFAFSLGRATKSQRKKRNG